MFEMFLDRCTFYSRVSATLFTAAVWLVWSRDDLSAGICCFVIGWHMAIFDAVSWIIDSYRQMRNSPWPIDGDKHWDLAISLLSLLAPLVALVLIFGICSFQRKKSIGRATLLLCASCCVSLVDLIFTLLNCFLLEKIALERTLESMKDLLFR
jgi:hypothetical protein